MVTITRPIGCAMISMRLSTNQIHPSDTIPTKLRFQANVKRNTLMLDFAESNITFQLH
jgi:hypothetical protein